MSRGPALVSRFLHSFEAVTRRGGERSVLVALSGGLDSVVLLHLLRFRARSAVGRVVAAHFDHGMRDSSADDARWVSGLCRAWGVPLVTARAEARISSEDEARSARYAFLDCARRETGTEQVLTAHHADDQAETVLFRLLRGTGPGGLAGIAPAREPAILRPLLPFWRAELEAYAREARLGWREDPTNGDARYARNVIRRSILPEIERTVAPGARRALVRLSEQAREDEEGWKSVIPVLLAALDVRRQGEDLSVSRAALLGLHAGVQARLIRALLADRGLRLDAAGTGRVLDFSATGASGRGIQLGDGWTWTRALDRLVLSCVVPSVKDEPLWIPGAGGGTGVAILGGRRIAVEWGEERPAAPVSAEAFDLDQLRFPLVVRTREPGDRIRLASGTRKVKDLLLDRRIPHTARGTLALVVDAEGSVLWIPRVARAVTGRGEPGRAALCWIAVG